MWSLGAPPAGSLLAEGQAMADALREDFAAIGADVQTLLDARLPERAIRRAVRVAAAGEERGALERLAADADWTVVIAPETGGALAERCQWATDVGARLLSPGLATIALASNKQRTAEHLTERGIAVPRGLELPQKMTDAMRHPDLFPAVIKPLDGCGSQGVRRLESAAQLRDFAADGQQRIEQFVPGIAASVAVLCGQRAMFPLPACEQMLSDDGRFTFLGGRTPLPLALNRRAGQLALAAVRTLPEPWGYIGVDLVLGNDTRGREDIVIEINPRLTTSYVGLRALCCDNLAAAMLAVATGCEPALSWRERVVEFSADGRMRWLDSMVGGGTNR